MKLRKNECPWLDEDNVKACRLPIADNVWRLCPKHAEQQARNEKEETEEEE